MKTRTGGIIATLVTLLLCCVGVFLLSLGVTAVVTPLPSGTYRPTMLIYTAVCSGLLLMPISLLVGVLTWRRRRAPVWSQHASSKIAKAPTPSHVQLAPGASPIPGNTGLETVQARKDSTLVNIAVTVSPARDEAGGVVGASGIALDIAKPTPAQEVPQESETRYRPLTQDADDAIVSSDSQGNIVGWNRAAETVFGYSASEAMGQPLTLIMPSVFQEGYVAGAPPVRAGGEPPVIGKTVELEGRRKDGSRFPLEASRSDWLLADERLYTAVLRDITQRKQAEQRLRQAEAKYRHIFEQAMEGLFHSTPAGRFITVNPALASMLGYVSPEELLAAPHNLDRDFYVQPGRRAEFMSQLDDHGMISNFESQVYRKDGSLIWISETARVMRDEAGQVCYEGTMLNITARRQAEDELCRARAALETTNQQLQHSRAREETLSRTDGLTGLCNRVYFDELATREFHAAVRYERALAVMMIDVDDFKQVNDTFGHAAGDETLRLIARTAAAHKRAADVIARLGGDEFVLLLPETTAQQAFPVAHRIVASVAATPIRDARRALTVTLSIGIAELRRKPMDEHVQQVVERADRALYQAKADGGNRSRIFASGTADASAAGKGHVERRSRRAAAQADGRRRGTGKLARRKSTEPK